MRRYLSLLFCGVALFVAVVSCTQQPVPPVDLRPVFLTNTLMEVGLEIEQLAAMEKKMMEASGSSTSTPTNRMPINRVEAERSAKDSCDLACQLNNSLRKKFQLLNLNLAQNIEEPPFPCGPDSNDPECHVQLGRDLRSVLLPGGDFGLLILQGKETIGKAAPGKPKGSGLREVEFTQELAPGMGTLVLMRGDTEMSRVNVRFRDF